MAPSYSAFWVQVFSDEAASHLHLYGKILNCFSCVRCIGGPFRPADPCLFAIFRLSEVPRRARVSVRERLSRPMNTNLSSENQVKLWASHRQHQVLAVVWKQTQGKTWRFMCESANGPTQPATRSTLRLTLDKEQRKVPPQPTLDRASV